MYAYVYTKAATMLSQHCSIRTQDINLSSEV